MSFTYEENVIDSLYIEKIWHTVTTDAGVYIAGLDGNWDIIITRSPSGVTVSVNGIGTKAVEVPYMAGVDSVGIALKPGVFLRDYKGKTIVNSQHVIHDADDSYVEIGGHRFNIPDFESAERFICELSGTGVLVIDSIAASRIQPTEAASSGRTLRRHVAETTGLTRNFLTQIDRAQVAGSLLQEGMPISQVAIEAGYSDQAHMTKSLKKILGKTPTQLRPKN
jgi:AraC-like DNA-binding protein